MKFLYPGHNYLGPGNPLDNGTPTDSADKIAQVHDTEYHNSTFKQDIFDSDKKAISAFRENLNKEFTLPNWVGEKGLQVKHFFESNLNRTLYPWNLPDERDNVAENSLGSSNTSADTPLIPNMPGGMEHDGGAQAAALATKGAAAAHSLHGQTAQIFSGSSQTDNWETLTFKKTYRWFANTDNCAVRQNSATGVPEFKIGSAFRIPVEYLGWYLSPQEIHQIGQYYDVAIVEHVGCKVFNYGIRLPFQTNEANSVTANASAQYPLTQWVGLEHAYQFTNDSEKVKNILDKCKGDLVKVTSNSNWTAVSNLSARATSRLFNNYATIQLPGYKDNYYTPNTNEYAKSINGTMNLGEVFNWEHTCKKGLISQRSSGFVNSYTGLAADKNVQMDITPMFIETHPNTNSVHKDTTAIGKLSESRVNFSGISRHKDASVPFETALVDGWLYYSRSTPGIGDVHIKPFVIGMQHIMNEDESQVLHGRWEFATECWIKIKIKRGSGGIYIPDGSKYVNYIAHPSQTMNDNLQPSIEVQGSGNIIVQKLTGKT